MRKIAVGDGASRARSPLGIWLAAALLWCLAALPAFAQDFKKPYARGMDAVLDGKWPEVKKAMQEAIALQPKDLPRVVLYDGGMPDPYLPHLYLGVAEMNLGNCEAAVQHWSNTDLREAVRGRRESGLLSQYRDKCGGAVAVTTPPVTPTAPVFDTAELGRAEGALQGLNGKIASVQSGLQKATGPAAQTAAQELGALTGQRDLVAQQIEKAKALQDAAMLKAAQSTMADVVGKADALAERVRALPTTPTVDPAAVAAARTRLEQAIASGRGSLAKAPQDGDGPAAAKAYGSALDKAQAALASGKDLAAFERGSSELAAAQRRFEQALAQGNASAQALASAKTALDAELGKARALIKRGALGDADREAFTAVQSALKTAEAAAGNNDPVAMRRASMALASAQSSYNSVRADLDRLALARRTLTPQIERFIAGDFAGVVQLPIPERELAGRPLALSLLLRAAARHHEWLLGNATDSKAEQAMRADIAAARKADAAFDAASVQIFSPRFLELL